MCLFACVNECEPRDSTEAQPSGGILAAEAGCQIGKYIMNFSSRIEGLWTMRPLRPVEEPEHKYYEYDPFANRIMMRGTGAAAVVEFGCGSEMGLEAPTRERSLVMTPNKKLDDSTVGSSQKKKRSRSRPSKPIRKLRVR